MKLFERSYSLTVGTLDVSELDFEFKCKRNLKPTPNTCALKIYGLSGANRDKLAALPGQGVSGKKHKGPKGEPKAIAATPVPVRLEAGYVEGIAQIYLGQVRAAESQTDGAEIVTLLSTGDGEKEIQQARINVPIGPGTPVDVALDNLLKALKLGRGNVDSMATQLKAKGILTLHPKGSVFSGSAAQEMTDFCRGAGLEWSVQNGQVQLLNVGQPLTDTQAIELSADSGLIGSPALDSAGFLVANCLLIPELRPGVKVSIKSRHITGGYRITDCEYTGRTFDKEWYVKITAKKY